MDTLATFDSIRDAHEKIYNDLVQLHLRTKKELEQLQKLLEAEKEKNTSVARVQRLACASAAQGWSIIHGHGHDHETLHDEILRTPLITDYPGCGCGAKTPEECDANSKREKEFFDELERKSRNEK